VTPLHIATIPFLSLSHVSGFPSFDLYLYLGPSWRRSNKKPPGLSAQEVANERDVAFAVR
jgi:hypothetical protein